jgi:hypothetical protein
VSPGSIKTPEQTMTTCVAPRTGRLAIGLAMAALACGGTPSAPSPDAPATTSAPLRPQGLIPLSDQPWGELTGNGWGYLRRSSSKDDDIMTDASAPFSPPNVLRIIFTPTMRRDSEPSVHWIGIPRSREVYTSWWMKLSPNWTASPAGGGKLGFLHAAPDGQGQVYTGLFGSSAPHHVSVNTEWMPYAQKIWAPNVTTTPVNYDQWYAVDWYVKWESRPGAGDGIMRWWVNGVLNGNYTNVIFPAGGTGFQQFEFAPTRQDPPPTEQYLYIDHTSLSVR